MLTLWNLESRTTWNAADFARGELTIIYSILALSSDSESQFHDGVRRLDGFSQEF